MPDNETVVTPEVTEIEQGTQTEDINLESPENPVNDTGIPGNETQETETEKEDETSKEDEDEDFNPDSMNFDENDATFGVYNLSKFKDNINFENTEAMEAFNEEAKKLQKMGFTQEQVEYMCENILGLNAEPEQSEKLTKKQVQENLKNGLTIEEQRSYTTINNFVKETLKGTELEFGIQEIMANPMLVKLAYTFYKKSSGGKVINKANVKQGQNTQYTFSIAEKQYEQYLTKNPDSTREDKVKFLSNLYKKMPEKEKSKFEDAFNGLFNK
jgi:hypothetical protein